MRHNQYPGATAYTNGSGMAMSMSSDMLLSKISEIFKLTVKIAKDQEDAFVAFAAQHNCDLNAGGWMVVPANFDRTLVPTRFQDTSVRFSELVTGEIIFFRNPTGYI